MSQAFEAYRAHASTLLVAYGIGLLGIASTSTVNYILSEAIGGGIAPLHVFLFTPLIAMVLIKYLSSKSKFGWSLSNLGPRIIENNFDPGFFVEHFIKDMGIALDEARRMGLALPGLALAKQLYLAVQAQGHGRDGTHALQLALASLSDVDWKNR